MFFLKKPNIQDNMKIRFVTETSFMSSFIQECIRTRSRMVVWVLNTRIFYLLRINHKDCIRKIIFCFKSNKSGRISEELRSDFAKFLIFKVRDMLKIGFKLNGFGKLGLTCIFELIHTLLLE